MTTRTAQDHVEDLLTRAVVEQRTRGVPAPDIEAITLLETIAIALLLNPRAVLYVAFLARNVLLVTAQKELSTIASLRQAVLDLGNVSLAVKDTSSLEKAKTALLQMETQGQVSSTGAVFKKFSGAVDAFLEKQLAKNVRRSGVAELIRPSVEAAQDLPGVFTALKATHAEMISRLYSLSVGVPNFLSTPISSILGLGASTRARADIQDIIDSLASDPSGSLSRDVATRLVANRAVLRLLGAPPGLDQPLVDSATSLPTGYALLGASGNAAPSAISNTGPWAFSPLAGMTVQVGDDLASVSLFPQTTVDQLNAAVLVGTPPTFPLSIDPEESLFVRVTAQDSQNWTFSAQSDGTYTSSVAALGSGWDLESGIFVTTLRANLNPSSSTTSMTMADVLLAIDSQLDPLISAFEYIRPGTGRVYLWADPVYIKTMAISAIKISLSLSTLGTPSIYTLSAAEDLGFFVGQYDLQGATSRLQVEEAFNLFFDGIATIQRNADGTMVVTANIDAPLTSMTINGVAAAVLGIAGTFTATSDRVRLFGTILGVAQDPVSPVALVDVGDVLVSSAGSARISAVSTNAMTLDAALPSFSGELSVSSGLYRSWTALDAAIQAFVDDWISGPFATSLTKLDAVLAPLAGDPTPAQRNAAVAMLDKLTTNVQGLVAALSSSQIPVGAGAREKKVVDNIVQSLLERKFDRAVDLFMRCQVQEMFELDWQSASFAGAILKAASNIARTDLFFPNRAKEEGSDAKALNDRREFPP